MIKGCGKKAPFRDCTSDSDNQILFLKLLFDDIRALVFCMDGIGRLDDMVSFLGLLVI